MTIGAVVVTYNRLDKLKTALESFDNQSSPPDYLIVVDNGCTDNTSVYLDDWSSVAKSSFVRIVIKNPVNIGGAGGFCTGMRAALNLDIDWIWVSDDDAYPDPEAFEILKRFLNSDISNNYSVVCSSVLTENHYELAHRRRLIKKRLVIEEKFVSEKEYDYESFDFDIYSFVGSVFRREALEAIGLPIQEYFIHFDDSEHSFRMMKHGKCICVPSIRVYHDLEYDIDAGYQWKDYYLIRNRMDAIRRNFPKRYYTVICIKRIMDLTYAWLGKDKTWARLFTDAVLDAWKGRLGLHRVYKPGWRPGVFQGNPNGEEK